MFKSNQRNPEWKKSHKSARPTCFDDLKIYYGHQLSYNDIYSVKHTLLFWFQKWLERTPGLQRHDFRFWQAFEIAVGRWLDETIYQPYIVMLFKIHIKFISSRNFEVQYINGYLISKDVQICLWLKTKQHKIVFIVIYGQKVPVLFEHIYENNVIQITFTYMYLTYWKLQKLIKDIYV